MWLRKSILETKRQVSPLLKRTYWFQVRLGFHVRVLWWFPELLLSNCVAKKSYLPFGPSGIPKTVIIIIHVRLLWGLNDTICNVCGSELCTAEASLWCVTNDGMGKKRLCAQTTTSRILSMKASPVNWAMKKQNNFF